MPKKGKKGGPARSNRRRIPRGVTRTASGKFAKRRGGGSR